MKFKLIESWEDNWLYDLSSWDYNISDEVHRDAVQINPNDILYELEKEYSYEDMAKILYQNGLIKLADGESLDDYDLESLVRDTVIFQINYNDLLKIPEFESIVHDAIDNIIQDHYYNTKW